MSILVELLDTHYKITIEPNEEDLYVAETTLGIGILNTENEMYDIYHERWNRIGHDEYILTKVKVEKTTQLILPTDETIEDEEGGKLCYYVTSESDGYEVTFSALHNKVVRQDYIGKNAYDKLLKGCMILAPFDGNKFIILNISFVNLQFFIKGIESAHILLTAGGRDDSL